MKIWPFGKKDAPKNEALDWNDDRLYERLVEAGAVSSSGPVVNQTTAMKFSAVYACVSLLAGLIASLPCEIYRRGEGSDTKAYDHELWPLLHDEPNPITTAFVFWESIGYHMFLAGNGLGLIVRDRIGRVSSLVWVPTNRVCPKFNEERTRINYQVSMEDGRVFVFDQADVLHFPCIGWDGLKGMSPISAARDSIGLGLSAVDFGAQYFNNAIKSDTVISFPNEFKTEEAGQKFREYLLRRYGGGENAHLPLVLTKGAEAKNLKLSAADAQLIESRDFQVEDICRFYGVPLHLVSSTKKTTSWGTGIEQQTLGFVKFTLRKHLKRIEQEINRKVIRDPRFYCKFNIEALLRGDTKTRAEFYKSMMGGSNMPGAMTPNEVRRLEGLPPKEGGDQLYWPPEKTESGDTPENNKGES